MGWSDGVLVRRTMKAYLHLLLAVCVLLAADVGAVQLASTFLLDLLERSADFFELTLVEGVLEAAALLVLLLELLELFLFLFEFSKSSVNVIQKVVDLVALCISLSHDSERFCTTLLVNLGSGDFFQEG